jgi:hypothetical protein
MPIHRIKNGYARSFIALTLVLLGIVGLGLIPFGYACVGFSGDRTYWWISGLGVAIVIGVVSLAVKLNKKR